MYSTEYCKKYIESYVNEMARWTHRAGWTYTASPAATGSSLWK
jgi:hypothetical protein